MNSTLGSVVPLAMFVSCLSVHSTMNINPGEIPGPYHFKRKKDIYSSVINIFQEFSNIGMFIKYVLIAG